MGIFDEMKNDMMKTIAMIGGLLAIVFVFFAMSVSIWLLVVPAVLIGIIFLLYQMWRSGNLNI